MKGLQVSHWNGFELLIARIYKVINQKTVVRELSRLRRKYRKSQRPLRLAA